MSKIVCVDLVQFVQVCAELVREGVAFQGDASKLSITLTGGF